MNFKDAIRTLRSKEKILSYHQLTTTWGEQIDPDHVLEEYPRPQLKREQYTNLNGFWNYCITKDDRIPDQFTDQILVPFSPECILSGVNRQLKPDEFLWYERSLTNDQKPEGKRCILHFGAVDQYCEVYLNKKLITKHMGGYLPIDADITKALKEGENQLIVKVKDVSDTSYHSKGKQKLKRGGMFYTAQSGIWQTVWMEWVPEYYIEALKITPQVNNSAVQVEVIMNRPVVGPESEIIYHIDVMDQGYLKQSLVSRNPNNIITLTEFTYWSPENPYIYDLIITVGDDRVESYFAMRCFEVKKDKEGFLRIYLNHEPYFQNGLLDQGYWPEGLYTAPSDEALIFDIQKAKELGYNMLRKHIKIEPLRWYYHCDRLGMIVWQDMVNGGGNYNMLFVGYLPTLFPKAADWIKDKHYRMFSRKSKEGREEWTKECKATVEHLYNCPCIAVWVPFNEGWGQFDAQKAVELIHHVDKTRLIDHASGWFDQQGGDFKSIHNYFHILKITPDKRAIVLSEYGGYACYVADHSYSYAIYGYRIYLTTQALDEAYQKLFREEIPKLWEKGLSAAVFTQLSDVEDEVNGLFTYDRKVCKVNRLEMGVRHP
ncbi:MAG: hypothetical protein K0S47_2937 [Herbinix sp.]|jgi:hypothetical protein|nr:hypothetical protein [Herbinix sp.]